MNLKKKAIIFSFGALSLFANYAMINAINQPSTLISANINKKHMNLLSKNDLIDSFSSSDMYNRTKSIEIIHSVLRANFGDKYRDLAQQEYAKYNDGKNQQLFQESLQYQGMTPRSYLDSLENVLILQNEIKETYQPTKKEINNYYKTIHPKYWIEGVYITPYSNKYNDNAKEALKDIKCNINKSDFKLSSLVNSNKYKKCSISGIGLANSTQINQISSNDYGEIPSFIANKLNKDTKNGEIFSGYNSDKGYYIVKVVEVKKRGTIKQEKSYIINQIRQEKSTDENYQTKFVAQLFKEDDVKSNNPEIEQEIKDMIKQGVD